MKKQIIEINGIEFELDGTCKLGSNFEIGTASIFDAYKNPSSEKISIWDGWCRWWREMDKCDIWVSAHTCNFFSISGLCKWQGEKYFLRITYAHNRAYKVVE